MRGLASDGESTETNIFEAFLAEDCVQQPRGRGIVGHSVGFAEARQLE
jgi:hypothetical protein